MKYYYIHTNSYPIFEIDIINRFGFIPPEMMLHAYGYFPVFPAQQKPTPSADERLNEVFTPILKEDGCYYENWVVEKIPEESLRDLIEERKRVARKERDQLLTQSDWLITRHQEEKARGVQTTLSDEAFSKLLDNRQALRDITSHPDFPNVDLSVYNN